MNKYYMEFINELSLEEMAHLGKPKLKEIYDNALMMRENVQKDIYELQDDIDMYDELLTRLEVVIENDYI